MEKEDIDKNRYIEIMTHISVIESILIHTYNIKLDNLNEALDMLREEIKKQLNDEN